MKSILITGASSGIGAAAARTFLDQGWRVGLIARNADKLHAVAGEHPAAVVLPGDVTDSSVMEASFTRFAAEAGRLDVLFNNAGIFVAPAPIDEVPLEDWMQSVNVNLTGMFICARLAFGLMRRQDPRGGRIINNGSISAHAPREGAVCYTTTKHAITGLTRSLSLDGRAFDIACGQIDIGNAQTPMVAEIKAREPETQTMPLAAVTEALTYMAGLPLSANVQFMTVIATKMPFIGRG
ncbi:MAG: SDR family oxidoreductase [Marinibacterium sp.]